MRGTGGQKAPITAGWGTLPSLSLLSQALAPLLLPEGCWALLPSRCPFFQPRWLVTVGQVPT